MLKNTTLEGERLDYAFATQYPERRIEHLVESAWELYGKTGKDRSGNYIFEFDFEGGTK